MSADQKRLLVTGATGFLGSRTIEFLEGDPDIELIIAGGRTIRPTARSSSPKVRYLLGDLSDANYVSELFQHGITHIVHCAALSSPWGRYTDFHRANVVSIQHLLREAKNRDARQFVNISSPSIYFDYRDRWNISENDPLPQKFVNHYAATKRLAELELEQSGVPFVSLRPRALIGRGDTVIMPRVIRAVQEGRLRVIGSGDNQVDFSSVSNVAKAIRLSLDAMGAALNQHYNITNGRPVDLWTTIRSTLQQLGLQAPQKKVPLALAGTLAWFLEQWARIRNGPEPALTRYSVGTLACNFTLNISKARRLLKYEPVATLEDSIAEFVHWYQQINKDRA